MPDVDAVLQAAARRFYDHLDRSSDKRHLDAVFRSICDNSRIDDDSKFAIGTGERPPTVFGDGRFIVVFEHLNNWTISIVTIAYDKDFIPWDDVD